MHLPMTSIQDAWGVRTLDDRSDTMITPPVRRPNNSHPIRILPPSTKPNTTPPAMIQSPPVMSNMYPIHVNNKRDDEQMIGMLTILLIFLLADKLLTIWNKS